MEHFEKNSKMWTAGECNKGFGRNPVEVMYRILQIMPINVQELATPLLVHQCEKLEYCSPETIVKIWDNLSKTLLHIDTEYGTDNNWVLQMRDIFNAKI